MRTTLTIDDRLADALKRRALETGKSFKAVVNEALQAGLEHKNAVPSARPFKQRTAALGIARDSLNLDKALALAGELEDDELARKMHLRK